MIDFSRRTKLYQSEKVAVIEMAAYIQELVDYLSDSFNEQDRVQFHLRIAPVELDVAMAVPLGLFINEAVTNCLKYAFPDGRVGVVSIILTPVDQDNYLLTIADDGIGLANDFDLNCTRSLGMSLMKGLCKQLGGSLKMENVTGLKITVLFNHSILTKSYAIQAKSN